MSRHLARVAVLVTLIAAGGSGTLGAQTEPPPSIGVLVDQVLALFPKVDGEVLEVQDGTVTLALGSRDGLVSNVELALYRQGRELRHPKTGEILGRTEQALGRLMVREVFEAYSTGKASQGSEVQPGDRARISAGKIKLTVVPLMEGGVRESLVDSAMREIVDALTRTGRFQINPGDAIGVSLGQQGIKRDDILAGNGLNAVVENFKIEQLLIVAFTRVQSKPYMDVRLFGAPGMTPRLSTALFVPPAVKPAGAKGEFSAGNKKDQPAAPQRSFLARLLFGDLDPGAYSSESSITLKEVAKYPFFVVSMDVAVGSKDRIARMALTDGDRIYLYRITPERALEPEWTFKPDSKAKIFSVQIGELGSDGAPYVIVNRFHPIQAILVNSLILTTKDGKAALVVEDVNDILLAVDPVGDGARKVLWAQSFAENGFFKQGDATRMTLSNGRLVNEGRVRVPSTFRATGATFSNITGKGTRALAFIDEFNRLRIALGNEDTFRSSSPVGSGLVKLGVERQVERGGRTYIYSPEPMPLSVDLDGDGVEEIIVPQNQFPGRLAVVYKGPGGYRFQGVNSGFEGTVVALGAVTGDGTPSLVAAVARNTNFLNTQGETTIIMTSVE
jgi:hypothetical protein